MIPTDWLVYAGAIQPSRPGEPQFFLLYAWVAEDFGVSGGTQGRRRVSRSHSAAAVRWIVYGAQKCDN
jgi:hypothetical protein